MSVLELARRAAEAVSPPPNECEKSELSEERVPPWDPIAAGMALVELRSEVERVKASFAGTPPPALQLLLADAMRIGERLIATHEDERRRG
jgi:hypothetical protein